MQAAACVIGLVSLMVLILLVVELRRTRIILASMMYSVSESMTDVARHLAEDGPARYALAGMLVVQKGQKRSTSELRNELHEILDEWKKTERVVGELRETIERLKSAGTPQGRPLGQQSEANRESS